MGARRIKKFLKDNKWLLLAVPGTITGIAIGRWISGLVLDALYF